MQFGHLCDDQLHPRRQFAHKGVDGRAGPARCSEQEPNLRSRNLFLE